MTEFQIESFCQIIVASYVLVAYYIWQWNEIKKKKSAKERFQQSVQDEIYAAGRRVEDKCVLLDAKVAKIEKNIAALAVVVAQNDEDVVR